ncbi:MAG TPA: nuclear transport factor 2 family protein [Solirubrobacteraceae bacterium]|nr:nuclear transport factor 2 family protein [Solirubrobacteraceae bacterium]
MSAEAVELVRAIHPGPDVDLVPLVNDDEACVRWGELFGHLFDRSFQGTIRFPGMAPVTFLGLDGLRNVWRAWLSHWASFHVEIEDVIDSGAFVVVVNRCHGRHLPDAPAETLGRTVLWTVRDGHIMCVDFHVPHTQALAMAGLSQ